MRVIRPSDIAGTHRDRMVGDGSAHAMCYLAEEDGCGFSLSTLTIDGDSTGFPLHYRNHVEVNLVLAGAGHIENLETGERWDVAPGTVYVVGPADRHTVEMAGPVDVISLFNPPILGREHHQDFGGYPPSGPIPEGWGPAGGGPGSRRMFVKRLEDVPVVRLGDGAAEARRYLTKADDVGMTLSDLRARGRDVPTDLWYKNHVEANFVIAGHPKVENRDTGESWELEPRDLYVVGPEDRHRISNPGDVHVLSVFNPPLVGNETHDEDGAYPPTRDIPEAWRP